MNDHLIGEDITLFLEQDIKNTRSKSWNRLDKTTKLEKKYNFTLTQIVDKLPKIQHTFVMEKEYVR